MNIGILTHDSGIYRIYNKITTESYIGQSINIKRRILNHINVAYNVNAPEYCYPLYQSIRKYGLDQFEVYILENCPPSELNNREIYWINLFDTYVHGYNQTIGGTDIKQPPKYLNQLIVDLQTGTLPYKDLSAKYLLTTQQIGLINRGISFKQSNLSYPLRKNTREVVLCDPITCEVYEAFDSVTDAAHFMHTSTTTISQVCLGHRLNYKDYYFQYANNIQPQRSRINSKIVLQIDVKTNEIIQEFNSLQEAADALGISAKDNIGRVCRGERNICKGYKWKYKE